MNNELNYRTIEKSSIAEFKDRGSRFIAYAFPIDGIQSFKEKLALLKKEHSKAAHHCFAYRLGLDGNSLPAGQAGFRVADDGEPSGSAGRPILGQIDSKQLTNVLVVVVRYFGGTLLGVPGLINAYKTSAALALDASTIIQKPVLVNYRLQFDYTQMNDVMRVLKHLDCVIARQEMQLFCSIEVGIPKANLEEVVTRLKDTKGVELEKIIAGSQG
jgi:uncharacterized YigZ family protein